MNQLLWLAAVTIALAILALFGWGAMAEMRPAVAVVSALAFLAWLPIVWMLARARPR